MYLRVPTRFFEPPSGAAEVLGSVLVAEVPSTKELGELAASPSRRSGWSLRPSPSFRQDV
jgi:hypothetical protein